MSGDSGNENIGLNQTGSNEASITALFGPFTFMEIQLLNCWHNGIFYTEEFKPIKGFEGLYKISNFGRILSLENKVSKTKKIITGSGGDGEYQHVKLCFNGSTKKQFIHRLVAIHFIPNPENKRTVNHKTGDKKDNRFFLLEWNTYSENIKHAYLNSLMKPRVGVMNNQSIPISQFSKNGKWIRDWENACQVQREIGLHRGHISTCVLGKAKTACGFIWKRKE